MSKTMNEESNNDEVTLKSFLKRNSYRGRSSFWDGGYRPRRPETAGQATKDEISFVALSSAVCRNESKFTEFILDSGTTVHLMKASMEKYMSNIEMLQEGVTIHVGEWGEDEGYKKGWLCWNVQREK